MELGPEFASNSLPMLHFDPSFSSSMMSSILKWQCIDVVPIFDTNTYTICLYTSCT
ncbi:hypothetical protein Fmac_011186 [Flemingia macrophylla]|uniref:Uncharacterized protein n=1 Tax=Flemingia macrophylla TaxID=520843 RepID=A0ABD1MNV0_9FABA